MIDYYFEPQKDITTYELALCVKLLDAPFGLGLEEHPNLRRHFRAKKADPHLALGYQAGYEIRTADPPKDSCPVGSKVLEKGTTV